MLAAQNAVSYEHLGVAPARIRYDDAVTTLMLGREFSGMTWHITGLVKKYAGFGLYLTSVTDASMFGGISFDIKGTFTATGAGDGGVTTAQNFTINPGQTPTVTSVSAASWRRCWASRVWSVS